MKTINSFLKNTPKTLSTNFDSDKLVSKKYYKSVEDNKTPEMTREKALNDVINKIL